MPVRIFKALRYRYAQAIHSMQSAMSKVELTGPGFSSYRQFVLAIEVI